MNGRMSKRRDVDKFDYIESDECFALMNGCLADVNECLPRLNDCFIKVNECFVRFEDFPH